LILKDKLIKVLMQQKKYSETFEFEYIDSVQLKNGSFIGGVSLPEHDDELIIFVTDITHP